MSGAPAGGSTCGGGRGSGSKFTQTLVNQTPVYDRKLKIHRPRKKRGGPKYPMILSPRKNFAGSDHGKGWSDAVAHSQFQAAVTAALAEMANNLPQAPDMATAAMQAAQIKGAQQFAHILMNLAEPVTTGPGPSKQGNLKHNI